MSTFVGLAGAISSLAAASLWLWVSRIEVPDNIDTIVGELQRVNKWNAWAAFAATVAAVCAAYLFVAQTLWT